MSNFIYIYNVYCVEDQAGARPIEDLQVKQPVLHIFSSTYVHKCEGRIAYLIYANRPELIVSVGACRVKMCFFPLIF